MFFSSLFLCVLFQSFIFLDDSVLSPFLVLSCNKVPFFCNKSSALCIWVLSPLTHYRELFFRFLNDSTVHWHIIKSSGKELFSNSCLLSSNCSLKKNLKNKMINRYFLFLNDPDFTKTFISIRFNIQNITKKPLYDKNFFIFSLLIWCHCSSVIYVTFDVIYCTLCSLVCFL